MSAAPSGFSAKSTLVRLALIVAVVGLALAAASGRKRVIQSLFIDGPASVDQVDAPSATAGDGPQATPTAVRVVLIDGLGAQAAAGLPGLSEFCRQGLEFEVDVGFPTVSLPVQHVLWTGLSQQQSGVWYRIAPLERPPEWSLPARTAGSVAVAESHPGIVHSFGFSSAQPAMEVFAEPDSSAAGAWRAQGFEVAAQAAVRSASPLVFVHVLRVDEAGHAHGAASPEYEGASRSADALLTRLLASDEAAPGGGPDAVWFVVSDHGHRPGGGHAGAEESIRKVRACIGGGPPQSMWRLADGRSDQPDRPVQPVHLVDLSRNVADSLGLAPHPESLGRPLERAVVEQLDTVPTVAPVRLILAALVAGFGLVAGLVLPRGWDRLMGLVPLLALLSARVILGPITLSHPAVYPPMGRDLIAAMAPALVFAATFDLLRPEDGGRRLVALVVGPAGLAVGALVACGGLAALVGQPTAPPLMPHFTAAASLTLAATVAGSALAAALLAGRLATAWVLARRPAPSSASPTDERA